MNKLSSALNFFEEAVMVAGMAVMVFFNFFNVICRYLLPQSPFSYTEELVVTVFLWVSLFGVSYGYRKGSHTLLTVFTDRLPGALQPTIVFFSAACSALLMLLLAWTGYGMVLNQIKHEQVLPGMRLPMPLISLSIPLGAVVAFFGIVSTAFEEAHRLKASREEGAM